MAQASKKNPSGLGATLWALLIIAFMLLVIGHLFDAIRTETGREGGLIERTFTTARSAGGER